MCFEQLKAAPVGPLLYLADVLKFVSDSPIERDSRIRIAPRRLFAAAGALKALRSCCIAAFTRDDRGGIFETLLARRATAASGRSSDDADKSAHRSMTSAAISADVFRRLALPGGVTAPQPTKYGVSLAGKESERASSTRRSRCAMACVL
jgi:hypothetical protein